MKIQKVCVVGGGLMGRQIALNTAIYPYEVTIFDANPAVLEDVAIGSGPLDASFKAINHMLGLENVKLASYSLNAVTDGEDAIGEAVVKLENGNGETFTGTGLSTDIIEASIRAYVNGINKMMEANA